MEHAVVSGGRVRFYYAWPGKAARWHESTSVRVSGPCFYTVGCEGKRLTFRLDRWHRPLSDATTCDKRTSGAPTSYVRGASPSSFEAGPLMVLVGLGRRRGVRDLP